MTPFEKYQQFLTQYTAPQQGIQSILPIGVSAGNNGEMNTAVPTAEKSMYSNYYMDNLGLTDILGGISGLASKAMGYPSVGYAVAANNNLGLDFSGYSPGGGPGMSYGASNYSGAVDTGDFGSEAANESGGSTGGDNSNASDPGGSDTEGSFANGGRVNFAEGSDIIPFEKIKLFDLLGEELYVDWDSFSEIYDLHGGDRMWKGIPGRPGYAMGGRVSYLQGGIVSLLGDYYGKR